MRIVLLTQNENVYLPRCLALVCRELKSDICAVVTAPAMSTHGGAVKGFMRHVRLFGPWGTTVMVRRVLVNRLLDRVQPGTDARRPCSVRAAARAYGLPYEHVHRINGRQFLQRVDELGPDLLISLSCPQIIGTRLRERFPLGAINVHGAPLPRYRGLMPAFWALANGEEKTAVTVHDLDDQLDNGPILVQEEVPISPDDTWDSLVTKTKVAGAEALIRAVGQIKVGTVERRPNREEEATYFSFPLARDRKVFLGRGRRFF